MGQRRGSAPPTARVVPARASRGARRVFVEGGGVTVSAFLLAGLLDRLQLTVSPVVIGEGRRSVSVPGCDALKDCLRPPHRIFPMGGDVLFDFDLQALPAA